MSYAPAWFSQGYRRVLVAGLCGVLLALLTLAKGIPQLRHDWGFPAVPAALPPAIATTFMPWIDRGLGQPQPYPTQYLVGFVLYPLSLLPPLAFLALLIFAIGTAAALAGSEIAAALESRAELRLACALISVFNPWTYTEIVAGHVFMLIGYCGLLWVCSELLRARLRPRCLAAATALLITQIEFWAFASLALLACLLVLKQWRSIVAWALAATPIVVGILSHYRTVRGTAFLLDWQRAESLFPIDAVTLRGYFAHYDTSFDLIWLVPTILAFLSGYALVFTVVRRHRSFPVLALAAVAILLSTGTKGPISQLYTSAVLNVTEVGVFRELYDLLAFGAAAWCVSVASIPLTRLAANGVLLLSAALLVPWCAAPPANWFVAESSIQHVLFPGEAQKRIALLPYLQPLSLGTAGSGLDPDAYAQSQRDLPLNDVFPQFPVLSALADSAHGDDRSVAALGVDTIVNRPGLRSDVRTLQDVYPVFNGSETKGTSRRVAGAPILSLFTGTAPMVRIGRDVRRVGIFFGDDDSVDRDNIQRASASRITSDPHQAWIDARLAVPEFQFLGSEFEGTYTESGMPFTAPPDARFALLWTNRRLVSVQGAVIAKASTSLRWYSLPHAATLLCEGTCSIAAFARNLPSLEDEGKMARLTAIPFAWRSPWMLSATLPARQQPSTIRFAETFDPGWLLIGTSGRHLRLDQSLNAWLVSAGPKTQIWIVNIISALQFSLEVLSFLAICLLLLPAKRRQHHA